MNTYYLLYVMDKGQTIKRCLFSTYDKALSHLASCCRLWWDKEERQGQHLPNEKPLSEGDKLTVRDYFDYWSEMCWDIACLEVDHRCSSQ